MSFNEPNSYSQSPSQLSLSEAKSRVMGCVAICDHSEKEVSKKLAGRCDEEIIELKAGA